MEDVLKSDEYNVAKGIRLARRRSLGRGWRRLMLLRTGKGLAKFM